jgi:hypothetical protein
VLTYTRPEAFGLEGVPFAKSPEDVYLRSLSARQQAAMQAAHLVRRGERVPRHGPIWVTSFEAVVAELIEVALAPDEFAAEPRKEVVLAVRDVRTSRERKKASRT